jgi:hypothetical protein
MLNHTVISIFKNHPDIAVTPADINILHNYTKTNLKDRDEADKSFVREICLPGMTEDFRLPVLYTYCSRSDLKICYVCEEITPESQKKLTGISNRIFSDLYLDKLISFLEHSEIIMFNEVVLPDTKCVIIANHQLEQYTHYNLPHSFSDYSPT